MSCLWNLWKNFHWNEELNPSSMLCTRKIIHVFLSRMWLHYSPKSNLNRHMRRHANTPATSNFPLKVARHDSIYEGTKFGKEVRTPVLEFQIIFLSKHSPSSVLHQILQVTVVFIKFNTRTLHHTFAREVLPFLVPK